MVFAIVLPTKGVTSACSHACVRSHSWSAANIAPLAAAGRGGASWRDVSFAPAPDCEGDKLFSEAGLGKMVSVGGELADVDMSRVSRIMWVAPSPSGRGPAEETTCRFPLHPRKDLTQR